MIRRTVYISNENFELQIAHLEDHKRVILKDRKEEAENDKPMLDMVVSDMNIDDFREVCAIIEEEVYER